MASKLPPVFPRKIIGPAGPADTPSGAPSKADVQGVADDIYDKLASLLGMITNQQASQSSTSGSGSSTSTSSSTTTVEDITGAGGQASGPQYAFIPALASLPSNNPTAGLPYTQDGLLIELTSSPPLAGQLYRYDQAGLTWAGPIGASNVLQDTHANRLANYPAAEYLPGQEFWETDNRVLLLVEQISGVNIWVPVWAAIISDTWTNILGSYHAIYYPPGHLAAASDQDVIFQTRASTSSVTVTGGTAAALNSGRLFDSSWVGYEITIDGSPNYVAAVASTTALTLGIAVSNATHTLGVASADFYVQSGVYQSPWVDRPVPSLLIVGMEFFATDYLFSEYVGTYLVFSVLTAGWFYKEGIGQMTLSEMNALTLTAQEIGLQVRETTYLHLFIWQNAMSPAWAFGDADVSGRLQLFSVDPSPTTGWNLYDGSTVTYVLSNGATTTITLENLTGSTSDAAYLVGGSPNSSVNAAVAPNFTGTPGTTGNDGDAGVDVVPAGSTQVSAKPHTHSFTPAGTIDTTGQPQSIVKRPWFRL